MTDEQELPDDYNGWTVTELRTEVSDRGLQGLSNANKAELVQALEDDDESSPDTDEDATEELPRVRLHGFGTCVPLSECPHLADEVEEDTSEE
jgi:hypothetical protein